MQVKTCYIDSEGKPHITIDKWRYAEIMIQLDSDGAVDISHHKVKEAVSKIAYNPKLFIAILEESGLIDKGK